MKANDLKRITALYYRSVRVRDVDGFVDLFAAGGVSYDPIGAPPHVGHSGIRAFLSGILALCEHLDIAPLESVFYENRASVTWYALAVGRNGSKTEFGGVDVFTFEPGGKISTLHAFWDDTPVIKALTSGS